MREFTKSMVSFSWSMSLLGVQHLSDLLARPDPTRSRPEPMQRLRAITQATEDQLSEGLREAFRTGDKFQRGVVDMMFGLINLRPCADRAKRRCGSCGDRPDGAAGRGNKSYADEAVSRGAWTKDDPLSSATGDYA